MGPGKRASWALSVLLDPLVEGYAGGAVSLDQPTTGKILPVRIITLPLRTTSVQFVVEDPKGNAVAVQILHVPTSIEAQELADWFPIGGVFGIKEPLFRSVRDGSYYIRLETPYDFIRLFPRSPLLADVRFPASTPAVSHWLDERNRSSLWLKEQGDKAFAGKRFVRAKEAYEQALDGLEEQASDRSTLSDKELRMKVYANLSQTFFRLEMPELARRAAAGGLMVHSSPATDTPVGYCAPDLPLFVKLTYRSALGWYRTGQYEQARTACLQVQNADPENVEAPALLERIKLRQFEAKHGSSAETLRALWSSSVDMLSRNRRVPSSPPDIANWIDYSALSIAPIPVKGNGLVARRPIKRGQLLMCCKPLAGAGGTRIGQLRYTAGVNLWTRSEDPWAVGEVVSEILWRASLEGEVASELQSKMAPLWAGEEFGRCGDLSKGDVNSLSPSKVEGAVTFNGFHLEEVTASTVLHPGFSDGSRTATDTDADDLFHAPTALYPEYPSALNHSCLSNCTYTFLSSIFLLRARVDIPEGEELVDSYVDAADPLEVREGRLAAHGFRCGCALCEEERGVGEEVRRRRSELVRQAEETTSPSLRNVDQLRQIVAELEATYAETTSIRPALYTPLRLLSQALSSSSSPTDAGAGAGQEAIANELKALQSLGARFEGSLGAEELLQPPRVRDMDGVMSALWIAKEWRRIGRSEAYRHWISLARTIEAGQAGEELFELRYSVWARKNGLDLKG
ncbi:hypothetical protein JCM10908_006734 [Rhodotorula pacifica]|uniref:SET domain-containing protein n=1 Tax=Rhodotorula pacifica TaxID=1495444 RepID=UPI0031822292